MTLTNLLGEKSKKYRPDGTSKEKKLQKIKLLRSAEFIIKPLIRRNLRGIKRRITKRN